MKLPPNAREPIAIIGIGCRFPQSQTPEEFWQLLANGVDAVGEIPASRWDVEAYYDPDPTKPHKMSTRWGGFIDKIEEFDPQFFGIAPREISSMDPQQRLMLEVAWEAIEDSGQQAENLAGKPVGVFVGISSQEYSHNILGSDDPYCLSGNTGCVTANRISYVFDFKGPSLAIDTACSSSLVATYLACESLWKGESSLALAGGVQAILSPGLMISFCKAGLLSPDGRCKSFDAAANGYVRGEGAGMVLLKPLFQAQKDGDSIYAVIRGGAINQDGRSNGMAAPNPEAQEAVLRSAYQSAGIFPSQVYYVEAHGTGTKIGDPIELNALGKVVGENRASGNYCAIGSAKTNVGHSETAAGITGVIKVALALKHRQIPPSLHFHQPNPYVNFEKLQLRVQNNLTTLPVSPEPVIMGVSSFGFGGTNAHLVLSELSQDNPIEEDVACKPTFFLLPLSAKDGKTLQVLAGRYAQHLQNNPTLSLGDICLSASCRRSHFSHRLTLIAHSREQFLKQLQSVQVGEEEVGIQSNSGKLHRSNQIAFLFTGQGSQYVGMGKELYESQPTFRKALDTCDQILRPLLERSLLEVLYPSSADRAVETILLDQTLYTQPAIFAVEYALAQLWLSWGIQPTAVMGHSVGEYVAACIAGVFSLEEGLKLIVTRARLMQSLPAGGGMLAILANESVVGEAIAEYEEDVYIAAFNGPENVVVSGALTALEQIIQKCLKQEIPYRILAVSHAFHSLLMKPILAEFKALAATITYSQPKIKIISNLTGQFISTELTDPNYWCDHICQPVNFHRSMQTLYQQGYQVFLEIGTQPTLLGMGRYCLSDHNLRWIPSLRPQQSDWQQLLQSLATLYLDGFAIDWSRFYQDYPQFKAVSLPFYPFQRQRYWFDDGKLNSLMVLTSTKRDAAAPLGVLGKQIALAGSKEIYFESQLSQTSPAYLKDHQLYEKVVIPATVYIEMLLEAGRRSLKTEGLNLESFNIEQPLSIPNEGFVTLQVALRQDENSCYSGEIFSLSADPNAKDLEQAVWIKHAVGHLSPLSQALPLTTLKQEELADYQSLVPDYDFLQSYGLNYGPTFRGIQKVWWKQNQAIAEIQLPQPVETAGYQAHPALLDSCFQSIIAALFAVEQGEDNQKAQNGFYLPVGFESFQLGQTLGNALWCQVEIQEKNSQLLRVQVNLFNQAGQLIGQIQNLILRWLNIGILRSLLSQNDSSENWLYQVNWQAKPAQTAPAGSPQNWLIFADSQGIGLDLAKALRAKGDQCVMVEIGNEFSQANAEGYRLNPTQPDDFSQLWQSITRAGEIEINGIVHLWSLEIRDIQLTEQIKGCGSTLSLLQTLAQSHLKTPPKIWFVTQGTQVIDDAKLNLHPEQATLWGLGKTSNLEYPQFRGVLLDLDPNPASNPVASLVETLTSMDAENQIAYRQGQRYVARLQRSQPDAKPTEHQLLAPIGVPFQLKISEYGLLENLKLVACERVLPGPDEVEIAIKAVGLNFRDVLNALGLLQRLSEELGISNAQEIPFGGECSGIVVAVGAGVSQIKVGDEVVAALAIGSLASHVRAKAGLVVAKPPNLSFSEAATISTAFLTAYYGLHHCAQIKAGDRVLIHAAAGGVGQAAVQLAQRAGAEIIGSASPLKWNFLKEMGVTATVNSRSLDFAVEVRDLTQGEGVDIVLNSLKGDFVDQSFAVLKSGGRFLEIGKLEIWSEEKAHSQRPDAAYFLFDLIEVALANPDLIYGMFQDLMRDFEQGSLKPLPLTEFKIEQSVVAFRYMAQAKHLGKVVITLPELIATENISALTEIRPDASYLITGGLGALGLQVAQWLARKGAKNLVLTGRSKPNNTAQNLIRELQQDGVDVLVTSCDLTDETEVIQLFQQIQQQFPSLKGVIHAAGVLDDGTLSSLTWERFETVMAPKVTGTWNLHQCSIDLELDFFICFSSAAALLGASGQGNYAAANSFMDAIAHYRQAQGLPALSINWGTWESGGMATTLKEASKQRLLQMGLGMIPPQEGLKILEQLLNVASPQIGVMQMDWETLFTQFPPGFEVPFLENLRESSSATSPQTTESEFLVTLKAAPSNEQRNLLIDFIRQQLAKVLGLNSSDNINPDARLFDLGLDSLMAIELNNRFEIHLGCTLNQSVIFNYPTVETLADYLAQELLGIATIVTSVQTTIVPGSNAPVSFDNEDLDDLLAELETVSDQEIQARLTRKE